MQDAIALGRTPLPLGGSAAGATRVAEFMFDTGLAQVARPCDIASWIEAQLYRPQYE